MDLRTYLGDSKTLTIPLTWQGSAFHPTSAWDLIFTAKADLDDADEDAIIQKTSTAGITTTGTKALIALVHEDTATETPRTLQYDIQGQNTDTGEVRTLARGALLLVRDATRGLDSSIPIVTTNPPALRALVNLSDVTISSPTTGQALVYSGTAWVNGTVTVTTAGVTDATTNADTNPGKVLKTTAGGAVTVREVKLDATGDAGSGLLTFFGDGANGYTQVYRNTSVDTNNYQIALPFGDGTLALVSANDGLILPSDIKSIGANKLIGRHTGTAGDGQEIGIDGGLAFQGGNLKVDLATAASTWRTELGLGSLATLSSVSLTSNVTGTLPVANGGTGATTAAAARANLTATADDLAESDYINSQPGTAQKIANSVGSVRVARMGDSLTENGGFPPGPNMGIIGQFGRGATATSGSSPTNNANYAHWLFGGSANGNSKQILASSTVEMTCGNATPTPIRGDRFAFYYLTVPGSGTFDLQYQANNSGSWTNIQTGINADGALAGQVIRGTLPTSGQPAYKLRVTNVTGAGFAFVGAGVYQQHGTGIVWLGDMFANGGVDFPNPLTTTSAVYTPILADLAPDLILSCWADAGEEWDADGDFQTLMDRFTTATTFTVASVVTTNNSQSITYPSNFQIQPGMIVTGTGIPVGTRIYSVQSATAATLSQAATASGTITATLRPQTDWVQVSAHPLTVASLTQELDGIARQRAWAIRNKQTFINMHAAFRGDATWMASMGMKSTADDPHLTKVGGAVRWHHLWQKLPAGRLPLGAFGMRPYEFSPAIRPLGGNTNPLTEQLFVDRPVIIGGGTSSQINILNRSDQFNLLSGASIYSDGGDAFFAQSNSVFAISGQSSLTVASTRQ